VPYGNGYYGEASLDRSMASQVSIERAGFWNGLQSSTSTRTIDSSETHRDLTERSSRGISLYSPMRNSLCLTLVPP
jgi:hypothetical protein